MARTLNPQLFGQIESPVLKVDTSGIPQKKLRDLEVQIENISQKMDRMIQVLDGKIQQLHGAQKNLDQQMRQVAEHFSKNQAAILSKFNERRTSDVKTQELFDRHQQLVQNFENRLSQIQKVTSEQEMKIMSYQATYDEVIREIRSMKRAAIER